ncbi:phosphotransferase enzyme family protein [Gorillibacterium timonense]|uniref:phosphotransferase enzyme family protein n=1 Tax=Gorillibacterium timonense TaxID=1689269 RepID=UPI0009E8B93C|nr:phosphotransferase [Gorillibacterium timonense]
MQESDVILEQLNRSYPLKFDDIVFQREGGCRSYVVFSGTERYFLKVVSPVFQDTVKQSLDILIYLAQHDLSVPPVLHCNNGLPYLESNESDESRLFVLFGYVDGREPEAGEGLEEIGSLVGRLHDAMGGYPGKLTERDKPFFIDRYLNILLQKKYPDSKLARFREYGDELWEKVKGLPRGYSHGDLHRGNLLRTLKGNDVLLDFDTSCWAYPSFDIATFCDETDYFQFDPEGYKRTTEALERFLRGYSKQRSLTDAELRSFPDWIAIRHYQLQATIIELFGLDCVDEAFLDGQLDWLMRWREQCGSC